MFASEIFDSSTELREFLNNVEALMRRGQPDVAATLLEGQLAEMADEGHPLAALCIKTQVAELRLVGWEELDQAIRKLDKPERPISAISIDISAPLVVPVDARGECYLEPELETIFYTDNAFPSTASGRDDIIAAWTGTRAPWADRHADIDGQIKLRGLGRLYGELLVLEQRCRNAQTQDPADHDAMALGSALVAIRLHQAVRAAIEGRGLPRPLTVMVGANGSFPDFDAAVITREEYYDLIEPESTEEEERYAQIYAPLKIHSIDDDYDPQRPVFEDGQISGASLRRRLRETAPGGVAANDDGKRAAGGLFGRFLKKPA